MADKSSTPNKEMQSFAARLNTFETAHQLSKRRASAQSGKKKGGNTIEWPHEHPSGEDLARAGFFYRPAQDSADNVQCFLCSVKLDGWEAEDDPLKEHLAHSDSCVWAVSLSAGITAQSQQEADDVDPMMDALIAARRGTFEAGAGWPHEGKRGWKCKITKMVEAGWCLDPAPGPETEDEDGDGVTCFYCNLSLDGWEPKDDPLEEHKRRSPECAFFALLERFGSGATTTKGKGGKAKGGRPSTASKASRLSTQSALSTFSEAPSFVGSVAEGTDVEAGLDDSVATSTSQATATGPAKGKKKGGRQKASAKGARGRKRANTVESEVDVRPLYPDLSSQMQSQPTQEDEEEETAVSAPAEEPTAPPAKKTRKGTRQSKQQQIDSSIVEISSMDVAPPKKAIRGRKPKAQPEPESLAGDDSEISAQLQEELERSMSMNMEDRVSDATPQPELAKPKRGIKRTSEGMKKTQQDDHESSHVIVEFPVPPISKPAPAAKGKRGRPSKQAMEPLAVQAASQVVAETQQDEPMSEAEPEVQPPTKAKGRKASTTKKGTKVSKASSTRSSRSSKATVKADSEQELNEAEDLERDEREIEAELERIAAEQQAVAAEQEFLKEFEASPSHAQKHVDEIRHLEHELQAEVENLGDPGKNMKEYISKVASSAPQLPPLKDIAADRKENATPSPAGSDKENQPSSIVEPSAKQARPAPILSPTKTSRIPLAPGTPNRAPLSPSKRLLLSPSKQQLSLLTSTTPWQHVDIDTIFLASPQPTPGTLSQQLLSAAGGLTSPEKGMTVETWVRLQAERGEEDLRRRCEEMVGAFEREGVKGLASLGGSAVA